MVRARKFWALVVASVTISGAISVIIWYDGQVSSPVEPPPQSGVLIGHVDGDRIEEVFASVQLKGAYSDQNSSFIEWAWEGSLRRIISFLIPDPSGSGSLLVYSALLFLASNHTHFLASLNVWNLAHNPTDTPNVTRGVVAAIFIDTDGLPPLQPPEAGISVNHLYGYGAVVDNLVFREIWWEAYTGPDPAGHTARGFAVSDGHNTTYVFSLPLRGTERTVSSLQLPQGGIWPLRLSIYLGFNVDCPCTDPFVQPRSSWPNDGIDGNPDGYLDSSTYLPVRVET